MNFLHRYLNAKILIKISKRGKGSAKADVMLTTDDKLEKMAMNLELGVKVIVITPY